MNQPIILIEPSEPKLRALLIYLSEKLEENVVRDELIEAIWGKYGSDEALNQAISKLRKHLRDHELGYEIETLPREGYKLTRRFVDAHTTIDDEANITNSKSSVQPVSSEQDNFEAIIENKRLEKENKFLKKALIAVSTAMIILLVYTVYHSTQHVKVIKHSPVTREK